jgi:hypothetical protein
VSYVATLQQFPMFYLCATSFEKGVILIPFGNYGYAFDIESTQSRAGIGSNKESH